MHALRHTGCHRVWGYIHRLGHLASTPSFLLVLPSVLFIILAHLKGSHIYLLDPPRFHGNPAEGHGALDHSKDVPSFVREPEIPGDI